MVRATTLPGMSRFKLHPRLWQLFALSYMIHGVMLNATMIAAIALQLHLLSPLGFEAAAFAWASAFLFSLAICAAAFCLSNSMEAAVAAVSR